jgi:hypothetical protein
MTKPNLLELAKQGNPRAIAALMNHSLKPKGIVATVESQGDRLQVLLEAAQTPNQQVLTSFVKNGLSQLNVSSIKSVHISGRQTGADRPAWTQAVDFGPPTAATASLTRGGASSIPARAPGPAATPLSHYTAAAPSTRRRAIAPNLHPVG